MADDETVRAARSGDGDEAMLAEAARGVIRQDADPRLDAHLARMLSDADAAGPRRHGSDEALAADVAAVRAQLDDARSQVAASRARIRLLGWLLGAALVAIVVLLVLVAAR
ncbi:MAG TPA: hypothetical protein VGK63_10230 [Candidatus Limnocylindrales bacterium]